DASEDNSTWRVKDLGHLSFDRGECLARAVKSAYEDTLFLVHREMEHFDLDRRFVERGELVYAITLSGFFGFDGRIRETGMGFVGPRFGFSSSSDVEWSIAPGQHYIQSLEDFPRVTSPGRPRGFATRHEAGERKGDAAPRRFLPRRAGGSG